jgi:hypothetical protein
MAVWDRKVLKWSTWDDCKRANGQEPERAGSDPLPALSQHPATWC